MTRKCALGAMVLVAWLVVPAWAQQLERTVPTRAFDRFEFDSETQVGFWAEVGSLYERLQDEVVTNPPEIKIPPTFKGNDTANLALRSVTSFVRFAYGEKNWEAGAYIPYIAIGGDLKGVDDRGNPGMLSPEENGVGDILLAGRYIPIRGSLLDLGAGGALSLPSGDYKRPSVACSGPTQPCIPIDRLGAGELGALPFITGALHLAVADVRAHIGSEFFSGSSHNGLATDRIVYGIGVFAPLGKYVALRNEFSGTDNYHGPQEFKIVNYLPGLDFRLPIGNLDAMLRVTGLVGVSAQAPVWGAGGSLVIGNQTMRAPMAKGGIVIE
jgi:hypothetical protein